MGRQFCGGDQHHCGGGGGQHGCGQHGMQGMPTAGGQGSHLPATHPVLLPFSRTLYRLEHFSKVRAKSTSSQQPERFIVSCLGAQTALMLTDCLILPAER